MSSLKYTIPVIAIVAFGAGTWWGLAGRNPPEIRDPPTLANSVNHLVDTSAAPPSVAPAMPLAADAPAANSGQVSRDELPKSADLPRTPMVWPKEALAFADRADPDPALSREIEYAIQRSIGSRSDTDSLFEVQTTCRGNSCQILSAYRVADAGMKFPPIADGGHRWRHHRHDWIRRSAEAARMTSVRFDPGAGSRGNPP